MKLMMTIAVLAALAVPGKAQTMTLDAKAAAAGVQAASEIARAVGRLHDTAAFHQVKDLVEVDGWSRGCTAGGLLSKTARGEAVLMYVEMLPEMKEGASKLKGREALLAQSRALAAIAGGEIDELTLRVFEKETARARRDQEWLQARERGLRAMMIQSGWGAVGADGRLRLSVEHGTDVVSASACGSGGWD